MENVALVHFRASKNVRSKTTECLLTIVQSLKNGYWKNNPETSDSTPVSDSGEGPALSLSKPEMEDMASSLREDLYLTNVDPLNALGLQIEGVAVFVPSEIKNVDPSLVGTYS